MTQAIAEALPDSPTPTPAFASRVASLGPSSPDRPKNVSVFGRFGNWADEIGITRSGGDERSGVATNDNIDDGDAKLDVNISKDDGLPQSPEKATPPVGDYVPPPSPALSSSTHATAENVWSIEDGRGESDSGVSGNGVEGCGDGSVVVFQLLMQRWELRPWVVVPRTLVATKEKVCHITVIACQLLCLCACMSSCIGVDVYLFPRNTVKPSIPYPVHIFSLPVDGPNFYVL